MREPSFWWRKPGAASGLLAPVAAAYAAVAQARLNQTGQRAGVPVICIGNLTVGGAGKTPAAIAVAQMLAHAGEQPFFLSRGYGGTAAGPLQVDPARHRAVDVGDEPLLLARRAPTIVVRDRIAGARAAVAAGASVIIMDDGFQNPSLEKDLSVLVVDAGRGIGNGRVLPAGPLRAPLAAQLRRAQAMVLIAPTAPIHHRHPEVPASSRASKGERPAPDQRTLGACSVVTAARDENIPVFHAHLEPDAQAIAALAGSSVLAFAGIGDPRKFFATLAGSGIAVTAAHSFPDHHRYTRRQAQALCDAADRRGLVLVTTEKDLARLGGEQELAALAARAQALPVTLVFEEEDPMRFAAAGTHRRGPQDRPGMRDEPTGLRSAFWRPGNAAAERLRDWRRALADRRSST